MNKTLSSVLVAVAAMLVSATAYAAPKPRALVTCGHIMKAETRFIRSTPVIYIVTDEGRAFTLHPSYGDAPSRNLDARLRLMDHLAYMHMQVVCLAGQIYDDILVANSIIARDAREARIAQRRAQVAAAKREAAQQKIAQQQAQQAARARQAQGQQQHAWAPWNRPNTFSTP